MKRNLPLKYLYPISTNLYAKITFEKKINTTDYTRNTIATKINTKNKTTFNIFELSKCHAIDHSSMQNLKKRLIRGQYNTQSSHVIKTILID